MRYLVESKAVLLGKNIDTDQIYPGRFLAIVEPEEIGKHCMEGIGEELRKLVPGSIIAAGSNFGCGSSREHAVIALMNAGVKAVVAESYARIFFRNAINLGLPVMTCKDICAHIKTGDSLEVDIRGGTVKIKNSGVICQCEKFGDHIMQIIEAGGIKPLMLKKTSER